MLAGKPFVPFTTVVSKSAPKIAPNMENLYSSGLKNLKTADIKIRVSNVDATAQTFDMDYLFRKDDIKFGQFFIYDPAVTDLPKLAPAPAPSGASASSSVTLAAATISAVAAVAALLM
jgi:hypothetical protein